MDSNFSHPEKILSILVFSKVLIGDKLILLNSLQFSKVYAISIKFSVFIPSKLISFKFEQPEKVEFMLVTSSISKSDKLTFIRSLQSLKKESKLFRLYLKLIFIVKYPDSIGEYFPFSTTISLKCLNIFLFCDSILPSIE